MVNRGTDNGHRLVAVVLTGLVHAILVGLALVSWGHRDASVPAETLSAFNVSAIVPPQSPPKNPAEDVRPETAEPVRLLPRMRSVDPTILLPTRLPAIVRAAPYAKRTTAVAITPPLPPSAAVQAPAPAPSPVKAAAPDVSWESLVLAHINRHKRYPRMVGSRRPEGTAFVVFTMDRHGNVTALRIEKSSGNAQLDNEAIDTIRRSAPLPAVPTDLQAPLELSVPVEFHHGR